MRCTRIDWRAEGPSRFSIASTIASCSACAARASGVEYLDDAVTGLTLGADGKVASVDLGTGDRVSCGPLVNAAGPRAQQVAAMAGLSIPVEPRKRYSFVFASAAPIPGRMPNVIDLSGTFVRPEGALFLAGNTPRRESELIVHGAFRTLDLSPFRYGRVETREPVLEDAVI